MPRKDPEAKREYDRQWYQEHKDAHRERGRAYRIKYGAYKFPRRAWTLDEDLLVMEHSMKHRELAALLGRSYQSIKSRKKTLNARFKNHLA